MTKKYEPIVYIFYGTSGIGKSLFAKSIGKELNEFTVYSNNVSSYLISIEIKKGKCVIIDGIKTKIEAEYTARVLSDDGFKTVLVEFKTFA